MRKTISLLAIAILTISMLTAVFIACRKTDQQPAQQKTVAPPSKKKFFFVSRGTENVIHSIATNIHHQNEEKQFVDNLIKRIGYPAWDYSLIADGPGSTRNVEHKDHSPQENDQRTIVYIPFVKEGERQTRAVLTVVIDQEDTTFHLLYPEQYVQYGFKKAKETGWDAQTLFSLFASFDDALFGTRQYLVKDGRIFGKEKDDLLLVSSINAEEKRPEAAAKLLSICATWESCVYADASAGSGGNCTTVTTCSTYWFEDGGVGSSFIGAFAYEGGSSAGNGTINYWYRDPCSAVVRRPGEEPPVGEPGAAPCNTVPWVPFPQTKNPCDRANELGSNSFFISAFNALKSVVNENREYAGVYTQNATGGNIENWQPVSGQENTAEISFSVSGKIDGLLHSHYTGLLPIFSPDDIYSMANLYVSERMNDPSMFTLGVVTASGTQYLLKIEDQTKFDKFAKNLVNNSTLDVYSNAYEYIYKIRQENTNDANEKSFLQYIQQSNSGLRLFKGNATFTNWESKKVDTNNNVVNNPCQ